LFFCPPKEILALHNGRNKAKNFNEICVPIQKLLLDA
jgi:hypothetical protein